MSTTYIDRTNTNHEVYRRANLEMGRGAEEIIRPPSDVLQEKRRKVLGHIIRRPRDHPQHQATFATRNLLPQQVEQRRVGRPRAAWAYETMKDCWRIKFHNITFQIQNREHREQIKALGSQPRRSFLTVFFTFRTNSCCSGANGSHPDLWF